jgi:hypothetical protein
MSHGFSLLALVCALSLTGQVSAQSNATLKKTIQTNYLTVNDLAQRGQLTIQRRACPGLGPEFVLMMDQTGKVRRYSVEAGSSDSAITFQHDYDAAGRLSFVLVTWASVSGLAAEWRVYFSPSGRMIDLVSAGNTGMVPERLLWQYITRDARLDWTVKWCP